MADNTALNQERAGNPFGPAVVDAKAPGLQAAETRIPSHANHPVKGTAKDATGFRATVTCSASGRRK